MKCYLCKSELIEDSGAHWNVGGRRSSTWRCRNNECIPDFHLIITSPDNIITHYEIQYIKNDKRYTVTSGENGTILSHRNQNILHLKERQYPLKYEEDLAPQIEDIFLKLKRLVIFS